MDDLQTQIATLQLGDQARRWLESDIGQWVLGVAQQEVDAATRDLKEVDPENSAEIRRLQNAIKVAEQGVKWLLEAIQRAHQVETLHDEEEREYGEPD